MSMDALWDAAAVAVDEEFGESVRIEPLGGGGYFVGGVDGARPALTRIGIVTFNDEVAHMRGARSTDSDRASVQEAWFSVSFRDAALIGVDLREGDRIVLLSPFRGGVAGRVSGAPRIDGAGRRIVMLRKE